MRSAEYEKFLEDLDAAPGYVKDNVFCYMYFNTGHCSKCPRTASCKFKDKPIYKGESMNCIVCEKALELSDPSIVEIHFRGAEAALNRNFFVCEKCALKLIGRIAARDPMIRRCNADDPDLSKEKP
jgi:hypothetical protein